MMLMNPKLAHSARKLRLALSKPFCGAKPEDVAAGKGKIATAYRAADELSDVLGLDRIPRISPAFPAGSRVVVVVKSPER